MSTEQKTSVPAQREAGRRGRGHRRPPRWVVGCATAIPVLMIGSWLLADALQPPTYSPVRQSVSVLAGHAGHDRWVVTAALIVVGGCYLVVAAEVAALGWPARLGLAVAGVAAIGIAASPEPRHGSTPQHLVFTGVGAVAIAIWPLLLVRLGRHWAGSSGSIRSVGLDARACELAGAVFVALLLWTFAETRSGPHLGLAERVSSSSAICWPALAVWALRAGPGPSRGRRSWPAR